MGPGFILIPANSDGAYSQSVIFGQVNLFFLFPVSLLLDDMALLALVSSIANTLIRGTDLHALHVLSSCISNVLYRVSVALDMGLFSARGSPGTQLLSP